MELRINKVVFFILFVASTASSEATIKTITTNEASDKSNANQTLANTQQQLNQTINETRINITKVSTSSEATITTNEACDKSNSNQTLSNTHHQLNQTINETRINTTKVSASSEKTVTKNKSNINQTLSNTNHKELQLNQTINETRINTTKGSKNDSLNQLLAIKVNNASEQINNATKNESDFIEYSVANISNLIYTVDDTQKNGSENIIIDKIVLHDQFYGFLNESEEKKVNPESVGLLPGKIAAILAGVFIVIAVIGYVMMLSWRRYFENRYGNREMLVNEDYCEKMSDLDHFSMASYPESTKDSVEPQQMTLIKNTTYIEES